MKKFLAMYMGSNDPSKMTQWTSLDEKTRKAKEAEGMAAWSNWGMEHSKSIIDHGAPLGKTKMINNDGVSDIKNLMAAYTIVQAESHEEAAKLFANHPHFKIFPGESVEIMECLPMPTK